jgi:uncharacterized protein YlxW (UPF0749 family)
VTTASGVRNPERESVALLVSLVSNTLDPGYARAAARRAPGAKRPWYHQPAVAIGSLLIGLTLVVAYVHTNRAQPQAARVQTALVSRVRAAQRAGDALERTADQLSTTIVGLRDAALGTNGALTEQLSRAEVLAGTRAVVGPGLAVTLSDPPAASATPAPSRPGTSSPAQTHIITDRDVRSVVNVLWGAGAEAIAVNNVRITPTSAIRVAGEAVLVDLQPITSPYTISAIGNADTLVTRFAVSGVAGRYQTLANATGSGFSFDEKSRLRLPASAALAPRYARAAQ